MVLITTACAQGTYPVDFFPEMHYQDSYHSQQPPRLDIPIGSVPITGKELLLTSETFNSVVNPKPGEDIGEGRKLYEINCAMCHGQSGHGDGTVLTTMIEKYGYQPKLSPDLRVASALPDSFLFTMISNEDLIVGDGAMPLFQKLLTPEERWSLVNYIKAGLPD
tara:strand:- start:271 stop:762 length:492 start_codon:yes stop_codon:yes gene_type:complete